MQGMFSANNGTKLKSTTEGKLGKFTSMGKLDNKFLQTQQGKEETAGEMRK